MIKKLTLPSLFLIPVLVGIVNLDIAGTFSYSDLSFVMGFIIYFFFIKIQKTKSRFTFFVSLLLIVYMGLSYVPTGASVITERFGEWFFLFFIFGLIQYAKE